MPKRSDHPSGGARPNYRFYALYDKVYRADVLWHAYRICQSNDGSPGVDGQTFDDIEQYGRMKWSRELAEWANYSCCGPVGKPYQIVTRHARNRLRQWLRRKHKVQKGQAITRFPDDCLFRELGLARLRLCDRNVPWAKAYVLVRKPDAGNLHVRFDERDVETEYG